MENNGERISGRVYVCPSCGGGLKWGINEKGLVCQKCGNIYSPNTLAGREEEAASQDMEAVEYRCPQCGAALYTTQTSAAAFCSFCGADVVLTERFIRQKKPDRIVPFRVTREECAKIYRAHLKQNPFTPKDLLKQETLDRFRPVYVPFYRYHMEYKGDITATGYKYSSDNNYDYTDEYQYVINGSAAGKGLYQCASLSMEQNTADQLQLQEKSIQPFSPAYLCGFYAEMPDVEMDPAPAALRSMMSSSFQSKAGMEAGASRLIMTGLPTDEETVNTEVVLMPVWLLANRKNDRLLYTAINGVSGEIVCDTPINEKAVLKLSLGIGLVFALVFLLLSQVLILRPNLAAALCALVSSAVYYLVNRSLDAEINRDNAIKARKPHERYHPPAQHQKAVLNSSVWSILLPIAFFLIFIASQTFKRVPSYKAWGVILSILAAIILLVCYMLYHKQMEEREKEKPDLLAWTVLHFLLILLAVAACNCIAVLVSNYLDQYVSFLVSDSSFLAPVLCICSGISLYGSMLILYKGKKEKLLWIAQLVLCAAALVLMFLPGNKDLFFYMLIIAMMALNIVSIAGLDQRYNQYVSRPVPYFGKEGEKP